MEGGVGAGGRGEGGEVGADGFRLPEGGVVEGALGRGFSDANRWLGITNRRFTIVIVCGRWVSCVCACLDYVCL